MLVLEPLTARMLADSVCAQLREWGERPCGVSVVDGGAKVAIGFEIIAEGPKWRRAIEVSVGQCRANEVQDQLNAWREKVRADLHRGRPSQVVRDAISQFGADAVLKALEHVSR
jgi:hypothetical protein